MVVAEALTDEEEIGLPTISRLARRDIRLAAAALGPEAARYNVDLYYQVQGVRIAAANRGRASEHEADIGPASVGLWTAATFATTESVIRTLLDEYTMISVPGQWARSNIGLGPVITAGLLAHIDITRAPTVGHIWRFAGLDPSVKWERGKKRPHNAALKVLCWKLGDSFVKQSGHDDCLYGHLYRERKELEVERSERGDFAEQAAASLADRKINDAALRATYESGKLPAGRLDLRARRYAVKLFLAHLHHVMFEDHYNEPPPKPYILTRPEHTHYLAPPNWPMA